MGVDLILSYIYATIAVGILVGGVVPANETFTIAIGVVVSALLFVYSMGYMAKYVLAVKEEKTEEGEEE